MTRLVLATRNVHKVEELRAILRSTEIEVDLVGLEQFPHLPDVVEDGLTFSANALKKARAAVEATGLPAVADDSGLCVDVLNGMPGVFSARWAGRHGDDVANLELLLAQIADVAAEDRHAHFMCAAALVTPAGRSHVVEGRIDGSLLLGPRGAGGFGYDPIFVPEGLSHTTAEMSAGEKNAISHRARAFLALAPVIRDFLGHPRETGG